MAKVGRPVRFDGHIPTLKHVPGEPPTTKFAGIEGDSISLDQHRDICFALGKMLQSIPKEHRKAAISRLTNVANTHRKERHSPATYLAIEGLIAGWEDWA